MIKSVKDILQATDYYVSCNLSGNQCNIKCHWNNDTRNIDLDKVPIWMRPALIRANLCNFCYVHKIPPDWSILKLDGNEVIEFPKVDFSEKDKKRFESMDVLCHNMFVEGLTLSQIDLAKECDILSEYLQVASVFLGLKLSDDGTRST